MNRHLSAAAALSLIALVMAGGLSGCQQSRDRAAPADAAPAALRGGPTHSSTDPAAVPTPRPTAPGTVSLSLTSPTAVAGSTGAAVACSSGNLSYRATVSSAVVDGNQVAFTVSVAAYRGPGSYDGVVTATLHQASGAVTTVPAASRVPVVLTSAGGSVSFTATGSEGRVLAGSVGWTCGS